MNVESFAIGVVTMVVFALAIITVLGILKVTSMAKSLVTINRRLEDDERELSREINMVEQTLSNHIQHVERNLHDVIENRAGAEAQRSRSYTDHRIDKLIDAYSEHVGTTKKVLKD